MDPARTGGNERPGPTRSPDPLRQPPGKTGASPESTVFHDLRRNIWSVPESALRSRIERVDISSAAECSGRAAEGRQKYNEPPPPAEGQRKVAEVTDAPPTY
eukprot:2637288-Pyramimonas_sp.AAC.1